MNSLRLRFICSLILLCLSALALRLLYIQVFRGLSYSELAQRQFLRQVKEDVLRGELMDRHGHILATSVESQSAYIRPKEFEESNESLHILESSLSLSRDELRAKIHSEDDFVWIARKLSPVQVEEVAQKKIRGFGIISEQKRYYPNFQLACHLVGTVGMDNHGLSGIEQGFDSFLMSQSVVTDHLRDGRGRKISLRSSVESADDNFPQQSISNSVTLTIDRSLQYVAEKEIQRGVEDNKAESGMVVIQNPKTGEILAMASYPGFDPNQLSKGEFPSGFANTMLQNPVTNKMFEPGSTFKIVTCAAALEGKKVSLADKFFCENGRWKIGKSTITDHEPYGILSFPEILEKSSNIGTAKVGLKLGKENLYRYARAFGFGTKTGICLSGETEGLLRLPNKWSPASLPVISFGQEIGVTAIQMVNAFSVIANGGFLMEPLIVKELNHFKNGKCLTTSFSSQRIRRVISADTAKTMCEILTGVVERGTGTQAKFPGYSVAGKTGTAQKINPKTKSYDPNRYLASFCGFVPAKDPQLVCLVILDEPKKNYWGGSTAAPIFSRIMFRAVQILGIPPENEPSRLLAKAIPTH